MSDVVVSIRMPSSLVGELKKLAVKNHYKDLSEEVRSIVRTKCLKYMNPYATEVEKLRTDLSMQMATKQELEQKQKLIQDLQRIVGESKNEN
jgi:metal-responsive CopG/Arc/MetJ family transcriptional regulator